MKIIKSYKHPDVIAYEKEFEKKFPNGRGWYFHWEWACTSRPYYYDGAGTSPIDTGPFKTEQAAYKEQLSLHKHDAMESKACADWCKEQIKELRSRK